MRRGQDSNLRSREALVFKTSAFDRSATPPFIQLCIPASARGLTKFDLADPAVKRGRSCGRTFDCPQDCDQFEGQLYQSIKV